MQLFLENKLTDSKLLDQRVCMVENLRTVELPSKNVYSQPQCISPTLYINNFLHFCQSNK